MKCDSPSVGTWAGNRGSVDGGSLKMPDPDAGHRHKSFIPFHLCIYDQVMDYIFKKRVGRKMRVGGKTVKI